MTIYMWETRERVKSRDVIKFSRQFSTMVDAGLPVIQCLDVLHGQQDNRSFKSVIQKIRESVEGGATLAEAFGRFPRVFSVLFVQMVTAGETGGVLDIMLERLCAYMEKTSRLKSRIKGALTYPLVTIGVSALVLAIILIFVIPVFQQMFTGLGGQLPMPTRVVIGISGFVKGHFLMILPLILLCVLGAVRIYRTPGGRVFGDRLVLDAPVLGPLIRKASIARVTRTMGTLMTSGVSILTALDVVAKTAGNKVLEHAVSRIRSGVVEGRTMAAALADSRQFPAMVSQMIAVGESTGSLDVMLEKIADFYDEEVDQAVENLTSLIEPILMVFLGIVLGGVVVAMYLPMCRMASMIN